MAKRTCSVEGCERSVYGHGWCHMHYQRWKANGDPLVRRVLRGEPTHVRFEQYVQRTDGCWLWAGGRTERGYGRFKVDGKTIRASRWAYEHFIGPIPDGLCVLHRCDNPPCVNPAHLFVGTDADNVRDCLAKGRHRHGGTGSRLTVEQRAEIRRRYTGAYGQQAALAREFGVHPTTICHLVKRAQ